MPLQFWAFCRSITTKCAIQIHWSLSGLKKPHVTFTSFNNIYLNLVSWSHVIFHVTSSFEMFATTITRNWTIFILNVNFQFVLSLVNLRTLLTFVSFVQTLGFVTCGTVIRNTFPTFLSDPGTIIVYPCQSVTDSLTESRPCWRFNEQDKVNTADSAFIFLIIQSQNQW